MGAVSVEQALSRVGSTLKPNEIAVCTYEHCNNGPARTGLMQTVHLGPGDYIESDFPSDKGLHFRFYRGYVIKLK